MVIHVSSGSEWFKFGPSEDFKGPDGFRLWNDGAVEERAYLGAPGMDFVSVPERRKLMCTFSGVRTFSDETDRNAFLVKIGTHVEPNSMVYFDNLFVFSTANVQLEVLSIIGNSVRVGVRITAGRFL